MSVDLNRLTAHLSPQQQADIAKAYHRDAEHSTTAFLYCFFLGTLGIHRFYLGQWRKGFAHLLLPILIAAVVVAGVALNWSPLLVVAVIIPLAVIALVWEIVDLFTIDHEVYTRNLKVAEQLIAASLLADHSVERRADTKLDSMLHATEAQATVAANRDQTAASAESAAVVTSEAKAVAEAAPALVPGNAAVVETIGADTRQGASAAVSSAEYIGTTTTQVSDDPEDTKRTESASQQQPTSWSETERFHAGALEASGAAVAAEEMSAASGGTEDERAADAEATANDFSFDQSLTRGREASAFSVTDSAELMTTMAVADATREEEQATVEEETPLSAQEAEAVTWPDHDPVRFDEPEPDASRGQPSWGEAEVIGGSAALAAESDLVATNSAYSPGVDATDMSQYPGAVESIADIEGSDAAPLYISLPDEPAVAQPFFDVTDSALPGDDFATSGSGEPDDGLVVFIRDQLGAGAGAGDGDGAGAEMAAEAASSETVSSNEPPRASYIPPTVPVITTLGASALEAGSAFSRPEDTESHAGHGETLAEVAGATAFGVAAGAAYEGFTHREDHSHDGLAPAVDKPAPQVQTPRAVESEAPVAEPAPVLPDATADAASAQETTPAEAAHNRKRHIRVVRQVKVGGEVIEEMAAEEYIDEDADPEPVRQRLEAMLRQQASGAIPAVNPADQTGADPEQ